MLHDCGLRSTQQFIERYTRGRSLRGPCRPGVQNVLLCVHFEGDWQGWVLWNSYGSLLLLYLLLFLFFFIHLLFRTLLRFNENQFKIARNHNSKFIMLAPASEGKECIYYVFFHKICIDIIRCSLTCSCYHIITKSQRFRILRFCWQ